MQLIAATGNKDKIKEFERILAPLGVEVVSPKELNLTLDVDETGETFAENAYLKAYAFYKATGQPALADDSGLCVDALGGRPGVHSARYMGDHGDYKVKIAGLLAELHNTPQPQRTAHFACAICCVLDETTVLRAEEICEGEIGYTPAGTGGFGYDPVFYVGGKSFAELTGPEKDALSHRGKALRAFAALMAHALNAKS